MDAQFERNANSQEWYTPKYIIDALTKDKEFNLDPCAGTGTSYAKINWRELNGYKLNWHGRVWLNPPYKHPIVERFVEAMIRHNQGVALLFNRFDSVLWQDRILPTASAILILKGRIKFIKPSGQEGGTPGTGSSLVAWGKEDALILKTCKLQGYFIQLR